ncbi:hypothetical protein LWT92_17890 [Enterobacter hormaechei]|uniref:hypothetical protein n=1 Tax=Enterobacteriaceae TaxID=543 RepID=UPI0020967CA4|nr:hypothetical protein [Lelliottia amnigena]MCE1484899.1 hypothetical protein [Enterobacter hormaechei]MCE1489579.1 hypothetical protein [Enterobacter hormaechei]MCE1556249.1 hypothetical protein [Enterobacter hormaechei]USR58882.1 hypothetical protein NFJ01_11215 [Lelliottia amnigena]
MMLFSAFTSDAINIAGFNRDASPVYKDHDNSPYFDVLSFELSGFPSERWVEKFKESAHQSIDATIAKTCVVESTTLTLSTEKTYAHSLQEFIDSLKKAFESVNDSLKQQRDSEVEQENELNDILDNLKF